MVFSYAQDRKRPSTMLPELNTSQTGVAWLVSGGMSAALLTLT